MVKTASCAVNAANLCYDKPYTYLVPESLSQILRPGMRCTVPFGKGNRPQQAFVLSLTERESAEGLKPMLYINPGAEDVYLRPEMIRLAIWLQRRCYCTLYEVLNAMFPPASKTRIPLTRVVNLGLTEEEIITILKENHRLKDNWRRVIETLRHGPMSLSELKEQCGVSDGVLRGMKEKNIILISTQECRNISDSHAPKDAILPEAVSNIKLNEEQKAAFDEILSSLPVKKGKEVFLVYGVTGSGKTFLYMRLVEHMLQQGKSVLCMVPEIALTPQLTERFRNHFGSRIALLHSGLSPAERKQAWLAIQNRTADIVLGTRSAVFAPIPQECLGLIIMDEEHDSSYKSESSPRYHAFDAARYRAFHAGCPLILGSATPSCESYYRAEQGDYHLLKLLGRFGNSQMARVEIADRKEDLRRGDDHLLGSQLTQALRENHEKGEQSILFLNRRGRNRRMLCADCGALVECTHCSSPMAYHADAGILLCHICGARKKLPDICPTCHSPHLFLDRPGTQMIEEEIAELLPESKFLRMDADSTGKKGAAETILQKFRDESIDILLGTQMITKGLDFDNVTLVGVLDADMSLKSEDYRAPERTFSLLTQVAGRAGRGSKVGRAILQTYTPKNKLLQDAAAQNYGAFYQDEIRLRQALRLPPFYTVTRIRLSGPDERDVLRAAHSFADTLHLAFDDISVGTDTEILGPVAAGIYKANNLFRRTITLKAADVALIRPLLEQQLLQFLANKENRNILCDVDENPCDS